MAGIDQITKEILDEASKKADKLISDAYAKAENIKAKAQEEADAVSAKSAAKAEEESKAVLLRAESQAGLRRRQTLLSARQDIISDVIEAAKKKLSEQSDGDYFAMIAKLLEKNTAEGEGVLSFSAKDLKRLPSDFASLASKIAAENNGKITIAEEAADIEDGFILSYGGIEENCTLKALFADKEDELRDCVHSVLWQ